MQPKRQRAAKRHAQGLPTFKPPSSSRSTRVQSDSTHANKYSAHRRTYLRRMLQKMHWGKGVSHTSVDVALRLQRGRQLVAMRLPSAVLRQQLQGGHHQTFVPKRNEGVAINAFKMRARITAESSPSTPSICPEPSRRRPACALSAPPCPPCSFRSESDRKCCALRNGQNSVTVCVDSATAVRWHRGRKGRNRSSTPTRTYNSKPVAFGRAVDHIQLFRAPLRDAGCSDSSVWQQRLSGRRRRRAAPDGLARSNKHV